MRAAVHDGLTVLNIVLLEDGDDTFDPGEGLTLVAVDDESPVDIGWVVVGDTLEPGPVPTPPPTPASNDQIVGLQAQLDEIMDLILEGLL